MGSDGRDDLRLSNGEIDSNPDRLLKCIEQSEGDLNTVFEKISEYGKITDDTALLSIRRKGAPNE